MLMFFIKMPKCVFLIFFWCWPFMEGFEIIILIFIKYFDPITSYEVETPQPLGGRGLLLHSLHLFKLQTEHLQLWKEHVFPFSDVQKGGREKLLMNYWKTTQMTNVLWWHNCQYKHRKIGVSLTRLLPYVVK